MTVDTLSIARELKATKMPAAQAEAIASAIGYTVHETVATKSDLRELEARIDARMEAMQAKLIMWMVSSQIALAAIILAALKL